MPKDDRKFRLRILNQVLLWGNDFRGEGSGNEDKFLNAACCAGPRFQAGKAPPLSPASSSFSGHQVLNSTTRQTGKQCIFDSSGRPLLGANCVAGGARDRAGSSVAGDLACPSGARAGSHGALHADSVSRVSPVVRGGHSADRGPSGLGRLRLLGGGHSADHSGGHSADCGARELGLLRVLGGGQSAVPGGFAGTGLGASCSGLEHVTRQACSSLSDLVRVSGSLSSRHVDILSSRSDGGEGDTNSCCDTHGARANACTLHIARGNSGEHVNSGGCTYNSCGGVRGGTKPGSTSTRYQVRCPAVEKLASLQQAPGRLHVETRAGRSDNSNLPISQVVEILSGCADMVVSLPPPFFSSVSPGPDREVRNGMGWSLLEKTARSGVWLFRGALQGDSAFFAFFANARWVEKGSFLTAWGGLPSFLVFLFILVWARHGCWATIWRAVLAIA